MNTNFKELDVNHLAIDAVDLWKEQWLLLTAGTKEEFNMMTVAWGSIGCMWAKPFVQMVVRPQRYTHDYTEKYDTFTLCAFSKEFKKDLNYLGTVSGRDEDKLSKTGLHVMDSKIVEAPSYKEASLILECKKIYRQEMDEKGFLDSSIHDKYPEKDYHTIYFGEILAAFELKRS